jgi:cyclopropane-fatty-acyl-phospholipid synthase
MAHYDLGDDFFAAFLDPTMTYSCGIFEQPGASMEEASVAKLRRACEKLGLKSGTQVLEIGSGWGSFALFAASTYGCQVTTATISPSQHAATKRRVAEAGLTDLVTVLESDYKQLRGRYDRLVSIEMVEAVGWRELDQFFSACAALLKPGGQMFLQAIVITDAAYAQAKRRQDFIKGIVFPGSNIPSLRALRRSAQRAGLSEASCERIGAHYVQTLASWRHKLLSEWGQLERRGYQRELLRLWDLYLAYCQAGFEVGHLDDVQVVLLKGQDATSAGQRTTATCRGGRVASKSSH